MVVTRQHINSRRRPPKEIRWHLSPITAGTAPNDSELRAPAPRKSSARRTRSPHFARGGNDTLTNIGGIYLLRYEPRDLIQHILPAADPRQAALAALPASGNYPVAYRVNLRQAQGYFLSQAVQMRDKDTILMTDASGVELTKLLNIARGFTGIYYDLKRTTP